MELQRPLREVVGVLALAFVGCFRGEFLEGDPCQIDDDCGTELVCEGGFCGGIQPPTSPTLRLAYSQIKQFDFSWLPQPAAESYLLRERLAPGGPWGELRDAIGRDRTMISVPMPLHLRLGASYTLQVCNEIMCEESEPVDVVASQLSDAIGYVKASNTDGSDLFGDSVALSADGNTLAVGAPAEDGATSGVNGSEGNNGESEAGAVYVFRRDNQGTWEQQAYVKASELHSFALFGASVALSADGNTLAVGSMYEDGVLPGEEEELILAEGAAYIFVRDGNGVWSEQEHIKARSAEEGDSFGFSVALSADGNTLAAGAIGEDSGIGGINEDQYDDSAPDSGVVYIFARNDQQEWNEQASIKPSYPSEDDYFGFNVALSGDGDTLVAGAPGESSFATGVDGDPSDDSALATGAAFVFVRDSNASWSEQAYIKASETEWGDLFGARVTLSADGDTLAVGTYGEDFAPDDEQADLAMGRGAVYMFVRDDSSLWSQEARLQPSTVDAEDGFGGGDFDSGPATIALSAQGDILAVGAIAEDGRGTGFEGDPSDDSAADAGAVYLFMRDEGGNWLEQAYLKATNTGAGDAFGASVALSADGTTLAVGAPGEDGAASGIDDPEADPSSDDAEDAGAVYLY